MPAFLTHFWILNQAVERCDDATRAHLTQTVPGYLAPGQRYRVAQTGFLGAMGPDWAAYNQKGLRRDPAGTIFDLIHRKKSGVIVANLLDAIRGMQAGSNDRAACLAFTLGYMAHIAGDIIVHPYVNAFAGVYEDQVIKRVFDAIFVDHVAMHMFAELHMDSYVAASHYGCGDQMSNGPNNETTRSWSDFLDDLLTGGLADVVGHNPTPASDPVVTAYTAAINRTYPGMGATRQAFISALGRMFEILDLAYDTAGMHQPAGTTTPPLDWWNLDFVEHPYYRNTWRRFEDFCGAAAEVVSGTFWPAAMTYLSSSGSAEDRKAFLKVMRDWNLDMGFATRVYREGDTIHVRYDHSWAVFFSEERLQRTIGEMNDDLMRVCRDIARISGDAHTDRETRTLTAGRPQTYQHDDMDYGMARVRCTAGRIRVSTSAAVWSTFTPLKRVEMATGQDEVVEIKTMDRTYDQDNRVVVEALDSSASYEIEFISWDR